MVARSFPALLALLMLCSSLASRAESRGQEVTWNMSPWPGLINVKDGRPSDGIIVDVLQQIVQRLPEYRHHYRMNNLTRGLEQLKREPLSCFLPTFPTPERDQHGYYVGLFVAMPHQLVVRTHDLPRFATTGGEVSLHQLLRDNHLRGGLVRDRSYGPILDPLLQAPEALPQLQRIQTSSAGSNLYGMLEHGRIDYLLDYAEVVQYVQREQGLAQGLSLLPLAEASSPYLSGIYCSRNAEGAELVHRIDRIARQPEVIALFIEAQKAYIPPATLAHYRNWLDHFFAERPHKDLTSLPH
ncbi:hypothetical protein IB234_06080 [Pseudomonas sp. PDM16]|uniref:hypothetical protein n=1 Tax=Pseudomonas sp. PDM16 TaxID=2769292 RepID=UPI00177D0BDA|nr:hypothetical protein [Pseudomonas sp. PDM16]MBD9414125.1 hypothetical protein [Pseudomonas sp. PDM16]